MFSCTYCSLLLLVTPQFSDNPTDVQETLGLAIEDWRATVAFKCTYTLRAGHAKSIEDGLAGVIDSSMSERSSAQAFMSKGVFMKLGPKLRYSMEFGKLRVVASDEKGSPTVTHVNYDESTNGVMRISYQPPQGANLLSMALIEKRRETESSGPGFFALAGFINPLKPFFTSNNDYFAGLKAIDVKSTRDQVTLVCDRHENGVERSRTVTFRVDVSPPVATELVEETTLPNGQKHYTHARISDFRMCGGGLVPADIRWTLALHGRQGQVRVQHWHSDDLGEVMPKDDDFAITVSPETVVRGLKVNPPPGSPRHFDLRRIGLTDLDYEVDEQDHERMHRRGTLTEPEGRRRGYILVLNITLLFVLIALIVFWKQRFAPRRG